MLAYSPDLVTVCLLHRVFRVCFAEWGMVSRRRGKEGEEQRLFSNMFPVPPRFIICWVGELREGGRGEEALCVTRVGVGTWDEGWVMRRYVKTWLNVY
ncbi:hypothetical protein E2C01_014395 [Portunus trituberculatus]|uniref:Uncharacterized protein n=1 Tax=Portunus trituberculatus TaxID=210409 RepID=A0A5B7DK12_PORTR|nr:hypothetical protein [Portunus trituberculatus]